MANGYNHQNAPENEFTEYAKIRRNLSPQDVALKDLQVYLYLSSHGERYMKGEMQEERWC